MRTERSCAVEHLGKDRGSDSDPYEERHDTAGGVERSCQASRLVAGEVGLGPMPASVVVLQRLALLDALRILQGTGWRRIGCPSLLEAVLALDSRRTFVADEENVVGLSRGQLL